MTGWRGGREPMDEAPLDSAPLDLSALRADAAPEDFETMVAAVLRDADGELVRRAERNQRFRTEAPGVLALLTGWARPILAAAAGVVVLASGTLGWVWLASVPPPPADPVALGEVLGLPATVATWLDEGRAPTGLDLLLALEDGEEWQ
jgi:hypothetical protein